MTCCCMRVTPAGCTPSSWGATTIWERWDSLAPDGTIAENGMNSLNHYAYGSIVAWLYRDVAGLAPAEPGFRKARLAPQIDARLGRVEAEYRSAAGLWRVGWEVLPDGEIRYRCIRSLWLHGPADPCPVAAASRNWAPATLRRPTPLTTRFAKHCPPPHRWGNCCKTPRPGRFCKKSCRKSPSCSPACRG